MEPLYEYGAFIDSAICELVLMLTMMTPTHGIKLGSCIN